LRFTAHRASSHGFDRNRWPGSATHVAAPLFFNGENKMENTQKKQIRKLKVYILGLHWDSNRKRAKAQNLTNDLIQKDPGFRFTNADYQAFYKSRNIVQL
jgi:hypothetical protein